MVSINTSFARAWGSIPAKVWKYKHGKDCTKDKSAASFCRLLSAQFENTFCNFYIAKNHKIAHVSTTAEVKEKISTDFESLEFCKFLLFLQILNQLNVT